MIDQTRWQGMSELAAAVLMLSYSASYGLQVTFQPRSKVGVGFDSLTRVCGKP
jgi:hypothetical protein